ncbi:MAG: NAD+ synthase [Gemmatimonadota bacterium]
MTRVRLGLAQINATVGDLESNVARMGERLEEARGLGVDVVAFPELAVAGYPPEDLLLKPSFVDANRRALHELAGRTRDLTAIVGFVDRETDLYNAAAVLHDGEVAGVYRKRRLPNYGVFDELRYFRAGEEAAVYRIAGAWVGVSICEDVWYPGGPIEAMAAAGAEIVVNINASPYHREKWVRRHEMLSTRAADYGVALAYVNMVGGQDELVFDGGSAIFGPDGALLAEAEPFEETLLVYDVEPARAFRARVHDPRLRQASPPAGAVERTLLSNEPRAAARPAVAAAEPVRRDDPAEVYRALVVGTRDYVRKNGFERVVLGLSGGIDSSLTAVVAADALGAEAVNAVWLPSRYSTDASEQDAGALAAALDIRLITLPIDASFTATLETLAPLFDELPADVTEENIQARLRGLLIMALSNKFGWLPLATGNKSEMATGYTTLYGDMAGGFAVLKDVPKTLVYELARCRNGRDDPPPIPERVLTRAPTAELRPDQRDVDSLPPYEDLDPILERYVEADWSGRELIEAGYDAETVARVIARVDRSEYKRRQAPPGVKITPRAFGKDRRLPITSRYREPID